ncbi:hypothetical protein P153DRAFT_280972 [Dothidotthia symphoricarpi CBS 119687]|uniref:Ubiquitin-like-conjugating enzyme ATG10 n=1 Tax=Dothidotthia symphoricarpi CBS 119687 TaxID=1392245 RepID=A0A6A6AT74_9PLEO|nr:uncharacterized protein P153DRAFT_280972 [Dothidotthia symphoricarpi CBS 119687]KAF2134164.1 hypothetical protein P153DRAFT_280972 [Dothidotthia symphoricarpi CBS 119687]
MLSSFPHLSDSEFNGACQHLLDRFHLHSHQQETWLSVDLLHQSETTYLRITTALLSPQTTHIEANNLTSHDELEDDADEETLTPTAPPDPTIHNSIILSPTYRVPVLYIHISDSQHRYPPTMINLYSYIIPPQFKVQTEHVGVMGGITVTDHPVTNSPVFFIHPCRTAEVMQAIVGEREVSAGEYLMLWIGALGKCVGLNVPLALMRENETK